MKKRIFTYLVCICTALLASSCISDHIDSCPEGKGSLNLAISFNDDQQTRGIPSNLTELMANATVNIYLTGDNGGLIRTFDGAGSMPSTISLASGNYRVDIEALDRKNTVAAFDAKAYFGSKEFVISDGGTTSVEVACRLKSVAVAVSYDASVAEEFASFSTDVAIDPNNAATSLNFGATSSTGYFTMPAGSSSLAWNFNGSRSDGSVFAKSGSIDDVQNGYKYTMQLRYTASTGLVSFNIQVDKDTENIDDTIVFQPDPTGALAPSKYDIWATRADLTASVDQGEFGSSDIRFGYRLKGAEQWTLSEAASCTATNTYATRIVSLNSQTAYQFVLMIDSQIKGEIREFTTDIATALPNGGFEEWNNDAGYPLPYASGGTAWWGNGNKAADMASKIISLSDTSDKAEGICSAKLQGQQIKILSLDKLAPGNIFSGEFVGTVGTSGGKVNFGRPFTARPTALKIHYKYQCGNITHNGGGPSDDTTPHAVGDPDRCHIYILLGDWDYRTYGGTSQSPVQVNTTNESTLMKFDSPAVIASAELVKGESVGWTEVTLPLDYKVGNRTPTHIIISCSSSKLGDYLTGSANSTLWVDGFELIY